MKMPSFEKPIFIVSCTNSGSKVLWTSLLQHPALGGPTGELHWIGFAPNIDGRLNRLFALFPCYNSSRLTSAQINPSAFGHGPVTRIVFESVLTKLYDIAPDKFSSGERMLFKEPKFSLRIPWILEQWPDAKIICLIRNPWAVAEGITRRCGFMGDTALNLDIPTAAAQWLITNTTMLQDSEKTDRCIWLRYEDLIRAKLFPNGPHDTLWIDLFKFMEVDPKDFTIPNGSKYSHFSSDKNANSLSALSAESINFITRLCAPIIDLFSYQELLKNANA